MTNTYLYIKEHNLTGLKYFGKTTKDPYKYNGSGKHWTRHIKKHGKEHVKTLWVSEPFNDNSLLEEFATFMSEELDIVNSDKWANLIVENGLDGAPNGYTHTLETRIKLSESHKGISNKISKEARERMSNSQKGRVITSKHKIKIGNSVSKASLGKSKPKEICPYCGKIGGNNIMKRWHFNNCKLNIS